MKPIAILIPTLRRPESLARALRSLSPQQDGATLIDAIVVVDNAPEASARATVARFAASCPYPVRYVHEPKPGVATARNRGLLVISAPHVAFLDDDETASPAWLSRLYAIHRTCEADVTFGPVRGSAPDAPQTARAYLERFFSREGPAESGLTDEVWGCGNSIMRRATALAGVEPFEVACDRSGGEDDRLFSRVRAAGGRFAWAADASVEEHAPAHRATLAYAFKRAYGYGQSPSQLAAQAGRPIEVAKWMAVGAAQASLYGAVAAPLLLARKPKGFEFADRAARGLGKVFWAKAPAFYGEPVARPSKLPTLRRRVRRAVSPASMAG